MERRYKWWQTEFLTQRCKLYQRALYERRTNPYPSDTEQFDYEIPSDMLTWDPADNFDLRIQHRAYAYQE